MAKVSNKAIKLQRLHVNLEQFNEDRAELRVECLFVCVGQLRRKTIVTARVSPVSC